MVRARFQNVADSAFGIVVILFHVRMDDIRVANVDNPDLGRRQLLYIVLKVLYAAMPERKQGRPLGNRSRTETRARSILCAHVIWYPETR